MRHCGVCGFIILTSLSSSLITSPTRAESGVPRTEEGGIDSGASDASSDASSGGAGGSGADARAGSGGLAGRSDSGKDGPQVEAALPGDASRALVGTTAVACGVPAGTFSPEVLPSCTDVCPFGSCVPASEVPNQATGLPNCRNSTDKCMPRFLIETLGNVRFKSCHSVGNAEGRCLPTCLPIVSGQILPVPQDDCLASERCIPCFNPIDGTDTGVCRYGQCDPGPEREPALFPGCCGTAGVCLNADLLPPLDRPRLRQETCGANSLCAPKDPSATNFACEVRGSEPGPGAGGSGNGGARGSGGGLIDTEAGTNPGTEPPADDGGCGCRVSTSNHENIAPWICFLGAAALARRRRVIR